MPDWVLIIINVSIILVLCIGFVYIMIKIAKS